MKKIAVVIPSWRDAGGLWYTVAASRVDLEADFAGDEFEIIGVVDGPEDEDTGKVIHGMRQQETCRLLKSELRSPQMNRDMGLRATEAKYVFFLDSHVIPSRGFFKRLYETAEETGAAIVHAGHCFWNRGASAYGYNLNWHDYFWAATAESKPKHSNTPYQIALAGHGAMCVNRETYLRLGGYWDALKGWGGEEPQLNLKAWMLGERVYMEPRVYHWHFMPEKRRLDDVFKTDAFAKNFMLVAYASGGEKYLRSTYQFFTMKRNSYPTIEQAVAHSQDKPLDHFLESIPRESETERALLCSGPWRGDLDALRDWFVKEGIPH